MSNYSQNHSSIIEFSSKEKMEFFNSFYVLFRSAFSFLQIFNSIYTSTKNQNIKALCYHLIKKIEKGCSLEEAFLHYENILGFANTGLIVAGEKSGKLDKMLFNIINNLKREDELKKSVLSSLTYPIIIICMAIAVFLFFKFFVLKMFSYMGEGISSFETSNLLIGAVIKIVIVFAILGGIVLFVSKQKKFINTVFNILNKLPLISKIVQNYNFSNFFAVLALACEAGVSAYKSLELAYSVISIPRVKIKLNNSLKLVSSGNEISSALQCANVFSSYAMSQISAGEKAGELDKMLLLVSKDYERELDLSLKVLVKVIEPLMLILAGIIVAYVAVNAYASYYTNLFNMF